MPGKGREWYQQLGGRGGRREEEEEEQEEEELGGVDEGVSGGVQEVVKESRRVEEEEGYRKGRRGSSGTRLLACQCVHHGTTAMMRVEAGQRNRKGKWKGNDDDDGGGRAKEGIQCIWLFLVSRTAEWQRR